MPFLRADSSQSDFTSQSKIIIVFYYSNNNKKMLINPISFKKKTQKNQFNGATLEIYD